MISPLLEQSAAINKEISFVKVNIDEAQELASEYQIRSLPTVSAFSDGNLKNSFMGVRDLKFIEKFINETFI